jgi:hypothetical protein
MALPKLLRKLFVNNGFGDKLSLSIIPDLDASNITSGKFTKDRMPDFTTCTVKHVASAEEQVALTIQDVQNGDIVVVNQNLVYFVQDDTKLNDVNTGYLLICSAKNLNIDGSISYSDTTGKLKTAIKVKSTGCVTESDPWDGSSNLELTFTAIDPSLCVFYTKLQYKTSDFRLTIDMLNNVISCTNEITITVPNMEKEGWNCEIYNNGDKMINVRGEMTLLNDISNLSLAPGCTFKLINDGANYLVIDSAPKLLLS